MTNKIIFNCWLPLLSLNFQVSWKYQMFRTGFSKETCWYNVSLWKQKQLLVLKWTVDTLLNSCSAWTVIKTVFNYQSTVTHVFKFETRRGTPRLHTVCSLIKHFLNPYACNKSLLSVYYFLRKHKFKGQSERYLSLKGSPIQVLILRTNVKLTFSPNSLDY